MEAQKPGNSERGRRDSSVEKYLGSGQQQQKKSQAWTNKCNAKEREWKNVRYTCPFQQFCICGILLPMLWFYIFLLYIFLSICGKNKLFSRWLGLRGEGGEEKKERSAYAAYGLYSLSICHDAWWWRAEVEAMVLVTRFPLSSGSFSVAVGLFSW